MEFCAARLGIMMRLQGVLQIVFGGAVLALAPLALWGDNSTEHSKFAGVYLSRKVGTTMNLSLGKDGSATVTEAPNGSDATTLFGHWTDMGGQVKVDFDAVEGNPPEPPNVPAVLGVCPRGVHRGGGSDKLRACPFEGMVPATTPPAAI